MVYKYDKENDSWIVGKEAKFPDGTVINEKNKKSKDGFEWHDKPPKEYLKWKLKNDYKDALTQKNKPEKIIDLKSLIISDEVIENRVNKTFSVAIFLDDDFYFLQDLPYKEPLTDSEIKEEVVKFLKSI